MTELKTLKDIDMPSDGCNCDYIIRREAIKWIKDFKSKMNSHHGHHDPLYLNCRSCRNMFVQIQWIKHFFNITDEELK